MSDKTPSLPVSSDLSALADDYEILGELDSPGTARSYIARRKGDSSKRRDDQRDVLIEVVSTPAGDEANALSHLAADTQLLARLPHRRLIPIIEGRWLGADAFAVVRQRIADPSLAQRLATGEEFTNPRIAAILREVNGLLEWARGEKVVHRNVTADRLFIEPNTDRVRVAFGVAPIRRIHHSDADDDARTIATLAVAMLTGEQDPAAYEGKTLADLRPDLPERLAEATASLLDEGTAGTVDDVAAYLALIGMADPIAAGESERERIRAEILEEQHVEREKLAGERAVLEREIADEREKLAAEQATLEREIAEEREKLAAERASLEREIAGERERLEEERTELQRAVAEMRVELQRAVAEEREQLVARRAELERGVAAQRAELERAAAEDRQRLDELRAELRRAGELEIEKKRQAALEDITDSEVTLDQGALATPVFTAPAIAPLAPLVFEDDSPVMRDDEIDFAPVREEPAPADVSSDRVPDATGTASRRGSGLLTGTIAALVAILVASATVLARRDAGEPAPAIARPATKAPAAPVPAPAAPVVARTDTPAVAAPVAESSAAQAARWLDSLRSVYPVTASRPRPAPSVADSASRRAATTVPTRDLTIQRAGLPARDSAPRGRDTTLRRPAMSLADSLFNFREPVPLRRDSVVRRDTSARPPL